MDTDGVVQLIFQKGLKNVNLSMFSDQEKKVILTQVAEVFIRQGKHQEVMEILEYVDLHKFSDIMKPIAEACMERGDYRRAVMIYEKIGEKQMAEFLQANFVEQ